MNFILTSFIALNAPLPTTAVDYILPGTYTPPPTPPHYLLSIQDSFQIACFMITWFYVKPKYKLVSKVCPKFWLTKINFY